MHADVVISIEGASSATEVADGANRQAPGPLDVPTLEQLRFNTADQSSTVLDDVLYGAAQPDPRTVDTSERDIRRDIVDVSVRIVTEASRHEAVITDGPTSLHITETGELQTWRQRFVELAAAVNPLRTGMQATAEILAQCAHTPVGIDKLVAIMAQVAYNGLTASGRNSAQTVRAHMVNAVSYADIAWCASHGELLNCPSWLEQRREKSEHMVLSELNRHRAIADADDELDAAVQIVESQSPRHETHYVRMPATLVSVAARLLDDGRWSTRTQRAVARQTGIALRSYEAGT